jgi:XTP/dITP diphosphohydrolase
MNVIEIGLVTSNLNKVAEMQRLLPANVTLVRLDLGDVEETGETFEENATLKAMAGLALAPFAIGEDSGLMVDALGGAPGVYSKRYAPSDALRIDRMLAQLGPHDDRRAKFVTVIALAHREAETRLFRGEVGGRIANEPRGSAGFGYDPIFIPDEGDGRTFAQMTTDEKGSISHRGRALKALLAYLVARFDDS